MDGPRAAASERRPSGVVPDDRDSDVVSWWAIPVEELLADLSSDVSGLSPGEATSRLEAYGPNVLRPREEATRWGLFVKQVRSPLVLILVFAAVVSGVVSEWLDAIIIISIVAGSAVLGFLQEYRASDAVAKLRARVELKTRVRRGGEVVETAAANLVPGDVVVLGTGGLVPADGRVLSAVDCHVSEAILTGETFPVEKTAGMVATETPIAGRSNSLWMGTAVRAGTAEMLVVATGARTEYGTVAQHLALGPPETAFERGIRQFGHLLTRVMVVLVMVVFAANVFQQRPAVDALLFAIALAVGIAPELLPAILAVTLAHGARRMAEQGVIVRQLSSIENLGSMEVLCTDKTGTLTEGAVTLEGGFGPDGAPSQHPILLGRINASLQAGLVGPLDQALLGHGPAEGWEKLAEIPFDFFRKRLSVVARQGSGDPLLICKGAFERVLEACDHIAADPPESLGEQDRKTLIDQFEAESRDGWRVVGVAVKPLPDRAGGFGISDEQGMTFVGYLRFSDPPKPDTKDVIEDLNRLGVRVKVISGDVAEVTAHLATQVGLRADRILTGAELGTMSDEALWHAAERTDLFVEVDPTHKERIVTALRRGGNVVGFMGDGVNDAPALHAADVGVSVDSAVDVAREAATFVLLRHDLGVLRDGIVEGRRTFANTLKYITTTESANFGNMISMAAASFFLPFLPLTATQVLLNNFLSDFPATTIATDRVDPEMVAKPERWNIRDIRRFMFTFGAVSSIFDFITFGLLLWVFSASAELFRTGWFVESLLTELVIALVVRTRRPFYRSRPGRLLLASTAAVTVLTFSLPYLPFADLLGFVPPSPGLILALIGITAFYVAATELTKQILYRRIPAKT
jgi:Mg2+-importing ATPase